LSLDILVEAVNRIATLPAKSGLVPAPSAGAHAIQPIDESILVVDDDPLVCDLLVQFLSLRGYRALGVKDGLDALRMVEEAPPDAILLDLIMPGMSGVDILRSLREKGYPGGIIIMTGSHNEELLEEAWALGPQEVLVKPIDLERLLTAIQLVLVCREC
jgi:CheY-like chemotaxis protein